MLYVKSLVSALCATIFVTMSTPYAEAMNCFALLGNDNNTFSNLDLKIKQPSELNRGSGAIRRWVGRNVFNIKPDRLSDLAEDMYANKGRYDLVFQGDKGLFTDLGIFDLLRQSSQTITLEANSTKTFYIVPLPSGGFVIYLKNKASYGDELSVVASHTVTGALIYWFEKNRINTDLLKHARFSKTTVQPLDLDLSLASLSKYTNRGVLPALNRLSKIHDLMGNKDLELSAELTSFQNRLQYMNSGANITENFVVETYKKTKKLLGFWGEEPERRVLTFFGLLSGITPERAKNLFEDSGGFWSDTSDRFAVFMGVASEIKMKQLEGKIPEGSLSDAVLSEILERHKAAYKIASEVGSFWHDYSLYTYLSAAITGKMNRSDIEQFEKDVQYIRKNAKGDHDGQLLILFSTSKSTHVQQFVLEFNQLYKTTKDGDVALNLLMGVQLDNYSISEVTALYERASFKGESVDSEEIAKLLFSGLKADLRPGQVISILREVSAYTGGKLKPHEMIEMVDSIINLNRFGKMDLANTMGQIVTDQIVEEIRRSTQAAINNAIIITVILNSSAASSASSVSVSN